MTTSRSAVGFFLIGILILSELPQASAEPLGRARHAFVLLQEDEPANPNAPKPDAPKPAEGEQEKPEEPAQELKITIIAVQGFAQVKQSADQPWVRAQVGIELSPGSDVRTNVRSVVQIKIEPGQTITLDRLGTIKIIEAVKQGNTVKTDVGMRYGRTSYQVEADKEEHDAKLHTPGTVMAIRGTGTVSQSDAYTESTTVVTGRISNTDKMTKTTYSVNAMGKATVTSSQFNPAQTAMNRTENNPRGQFAGLDRSEHEIIRNDPSDRFAQRNGTPTLANTKQDEFNNNFETMVQPMFQMAGSSSDDGTKHTVLQDTTIQFFLMWSGGPAPNLNFDVTDPTGFNLNATNMVARPGTNLAGNHGGDDMGGASTGFESVVYGPNSFDGEYKLRITVGPGTPSTATAQVGGTINGTPFATQPNPSNVNPGDPPIILIAKPSTGTIVFEGM